MVSPQIDFTAIEYPRQDNSAESTQPPPLKWAGGKRWQLPHILPYWQPKRYRRLVEPFCGGLAIALGLSPDVAMLNDINHHLINFYRHLKAGFVSNLTCQNDESYYYEKRNEFNRLIKGGKAESHEAAELFYYLNRTGYNGLCRFNHSGEFNVPFGRYKNITYRRDFRQYAKAFANWEFSSAHFQQLTLHEHDFVYADPPYDVQFRQYSQDGFGWQEQVALANWLRNHHGPVILVNQATDRVIELYGKLGYQLTYLEAPRRISCNGDRTPAPEVLAVRNLP